MDSFMENLRNASPTVQALAVSAGGLVGVFATLAVIFVITWLAIRTGKRA